MGRGDPERDPDQPPESIRVPECAEGPTPGRLRLMCAYGTADLCIGCPGWEFDRAPAGLLACLLFGNGTAMQCLPGRYPTRGSTVPCSGCGLLRGGRRLAQALRVLLRREHLRLQVPGAQRGTLQQAPRGERGHCDTADLTLRYAPLVARRGDPGPGVSRSSSPGRVLTKSSMNLPDTSTSRSQLFEGSETGS